MARRERTTGLPRQGQRLRHAHAGRSFLGIPINDATLRLGILGIAGALLIAVVGLLSWTWYNNTFLRPDKVVLTTGDREVSLRYYADRLYQFAIANPTASSTISQQLLNKLQEEDITVLLAQREGIDLSDDAITRAIGLELASGEATEPLTGAEFTQSYRDHLNRLGYSDGVYRRLTTASVANEGLLETYTAALPATGETVSYRVVAVASEPEAAAVIERVENGEDIGTIAQQISLDSSSRQNDGLIEGLLTEMLLPEFAAAFEGKQPGDLVEPFEAEDIWFAIQLTGRDAAATLDDDDKASLAQKRLDEEVAGLRTELTSAGEIKRNLSADDYEWAAKHVNQGSGS